MTWFFAAILGHIANGGAFIIDKILLQKAFKRSATYAGLVGLLSLFSIVIYPWVDSWPTGAMVWVAFVSGATFIFALRAFFASLSRAEASRVVPIVGSLIPIFTLLGTWAFLNERLSTTQGIGFGVLILATIILSGSGKASRPSGKAVAFSVISAVLFAVSFVTGKAVYDASGFLGGFLLTRLAAAGTAILMVTVLDPFAGREILSIIHPKSRRGAKVAKSAAGLAVVGQSMGAGGFILVQFAISEGSAAIVNALQAVQYTLIVLVAFIFRKKAKALLGERLHRSVVIPKLFAIALTAVGMALVVM